MKHELHPSKTHATPALSAIVAYLVGEKWTEPPIEFMKVDKEGIVWALVGGETFEDCLTKFGTVEQLDHDLTELAKLLSPEESQVFWALRYSAIPLIERSWMP